MLIGYGVFTIFACLFNLLLKTVLKIDILNYFKVIQISNVGFGASLMVTFLAMMFIPQFNISPEEKTLYLFYTFAGSYLLIMLFSFYSQITYTEKLEVDTDERNSEEENERQ